MEFAKTNTKMLAKPKIPPPHHHLHQQQQQQQQLQAASSMSPLVLTAPPAFINQFAARAYQPYTNASEYAILQTYDVLKTYVFLLLPGA